MNLNTSNWKTFFLKDLYNIRMGNGFDKNKMDEDNPDVNLVSRQSFNNGVDVKVGYVDGVKPFDSGLVTVALGGSYLGSCFVQKEPFYTAQNVAVMEPKYKEMTDSVNIFISGLVRYESSIKYYAFGRELNTHIRKDFDIKLPVDSNGKPDWEFMEKLVKSLHHKPLTTKNKKGHTPDLKIDEWKPFKIQRTEMQRGLLEIETCKCGSAGELDDGKDINYIGAKKSDNGVMRSVSLEGNSNLVSKGHGIMIICDGEGSVGYTNYMDSDFIGSTTTSIGYDDAITEINAMFLVTVLDNEKFKYSYGRKYRKTLVDAEIYLPVQHNDDGTLLVDSSSKYSDKGFIPDWKFMENYIKSLPYGDRLEVNYG